MPKTEQAQLAEETKTQAKVREILDEWAEVDKYRKLIHKVQHFGHDLWLENLQDEPRLDLAYNTLDLINSPTEYNTLCYIIFSLESSYWNLGPKSKITPWREDYINFIQKLVSLRKRLITNHTLDYETWILLIYSTVGQQRSYLPVSRFTRNMKPSTHQNSTIDLIFDLEEKCILLNIVIEKLKNKDLSLSRADIDEISNFTRYEDKIEVRRKHFAYSNLVNFCNDISLVCNDLLALSEKRDRVGNLTESSKKIQEESNKFLSTMDGHADSLGVGALVLLIVFAISPQETIFFIILIVIIFTSLNTLAKIVAEETISKWK